jgi:hypothetical protein
MTRVINLIRPFVPKQTRTDKGDFEDPEPHVALHLPFVVIANQFLRAAGYTEFTRRMSASLSLGSRYALPLGPGGIYEVLCSQSPGRYDIQDVAGAPITSLVAARKNKDTVLASFFDLTKIHAICHEHGLTFSDRLVPPSSFKLLMFILFACMSLTNLLFHKQDHLYRPIHYSSARRNHPSDGG